MRKGLIRRVAGRGRRSRSVRSGSGSLVTNASGKQYRVVAVDEAEAAEFADPPRRWGRVGMMAGGWALVLVLGASVAPGFAASGSEENQDPRDQEASSANNAAWRYLRYGLNGETDRAQEALCEDADPELAPDDLDGIRQSYIEQLGGITDVEVTTEAVDGSGGYSILGSVTFLSSSAGQRHQEFMITVEQQGETYCVSEATSSATDEPSVDGSSEAVDPEMVANNFLTIIVGNRDSETAAAMQCEPYEGITAEDLDAAVAEWEERNGWKGGSSLGAEREESTGNSITTFSVGVRLEGEVLVEDFDFLVGVQGNCIASLEGGEGLVE